MRYLNYIKKHLQDLSGQVIVITGANSGLGFEATKYLSYQNATVIMACRNIKKATKARADILNEIPDAKLDIMHYDQADFSSIDQFVTELKAKYERIHALICNAGIYFPNKHEEMIPGLKLTLGTNFIGLYYLLRQLMPYLDVSGMPTRVIFVSSLSAYHQQNKSFQSMKSLHHGLFRQYANSKLAINKLFHVLANGMNLHDFIDRKNVSFFLMHPGITMTNIIGNFPKWFQDLARLVMHVLFQKADCAALGIAYLAGAKHVFNGSYLVPGGLFEISGHPKKRSFPKRMVKGSGQFVYDVGKFVKELKN